MRFSLRAGVLIMASLCAVSARAAPMDDSIPTSRSMPVEGVVTNPDWVSRPTGEEMSNYYPYIATVLMMEGRVAMSCTVASSGSLENCAVASESPPGLGFGAAALRMAPLFKMKPETLDGAPVGGARVTIPIHFSTPPAPAVPVEPALPATTTPTALALGRRLAAAVITDETISTYVQALRRTLAQSNPTPQVSLALDDLEAAYRTTIPAQIEHYARIYAQTFPEQQLAQIVAFEESPAGRAWTAQTPRMNISGAAYAQAFYQTAVAGARARLCGQIGCPGFPSP